MSYLKEKLELKVEEAEFKVQKTLVNFTAWQKWIIFFCLIFAIPSYFITKAFANIYFKKQYSQYLIQAHSSFQDPKPLLITRIDVAYLGENEYAVIAQIANPNLDLAAKIVPYEFNFFTTNGQGAAVSQTGNFYILPNQKKYLIVPKIQSLTGIAKVGLILPKEIAWQKKTSLPEVTLKASQPKGQNQQNPFGYTLEGTVTNESPYYVKEVKISFLLFGIQGKVIGGNQRSEFSLRPYETRGYKQIWSGISGQNVVRAEASAETNLLDKENLSAPEFPTENGAGGLGR